MAENVQAQGDKLAEIDKVLQQVGARKGEIPAAIIVKTAKKFNRTEEEVRQRAAAMGFRVEAPAAEDPEKICKKYLEQEPAVSGLLGEYEDELEAFQVTDLYRFLYRGKKVTDPAALPGNVLLEQTDRLEQAGWGDADLAEAGKKLCMLSRKTFCSDPVRKEYDEYLKYRNIKSILEGVEAQAQEGTFGDAAATEALQGLTALLRDVGEAEKLLRAYASVKSINLPEPQKSGISVPDPETERAKALCEVAAFEIVSLDLVPAGRHLDAAQELDPEREEIALLRRTLQQAEERLGADVTQMRALCEERCFYAAKEKFDEIRQIAPDYEDEELLSRILKAVEQAEADRKAALESEQEGEIIRHCLAAMEAAADTPDVAALLQKYPPVQPAGLRVISDAAEGVNEISWQEGASTGGQVYHVVRKEGARPADPKDGAQLGTVNACSFRDTATESGKRYYYAVFAERGGIFSEGLVSELPVVYYTEISGVNILPGDGEVRISWAEIPENATVVITRQAADGSTDIRCTERDGYTDRDVVNDTEYHYCVRLLYEAEGREEFTKGVMGSAIPSEPPQAVDIVSILSRNAEGALSADSYMVEWKEIKGKGIKLYRTGEKPAWNHGDILTLEQWTDVMEQMSFGRIDATHAEIRVSGYEEFYVGAVQSKGGMVVVGDFCKASRVKPVTVKHISMINGRLTLLTEPVTDADAFVVMYRTDQYPFDLTDGYAKKKRITREQYDFDGGLMLDVEKAENYYVSVYTEAKVNGVTDYSVAAQVTHSEQAPGVFTYTITSKKKLFSAPEVKITFTSSQQEFELPAIEIRSENGAIPVYKHSSDFMVEIPRQQVRGGSLTVNIEVDKTLPKNTFIKPFLKDETLKDICRLMSSDRSKPQIN